jgi:hypothetical protein
VRTPATHTLRFAELAWLIDYTHALLCTMDCTPRSRNHILHGICTMVVDIDYGGDVGVSFS